LTGPTAAIADDHLAARAWESGDAESAFTHWHAAHKAGLSFVRDNLFAAARTVATQRLKADDVQGALKAATVGLALQSSDKGLRTIAGQAHFRQGHAAATAGRWDEAYEHWQAALVVGGERSRRLVINLALAEEQRENWLEAAELWREALRRRPRKSDHPDALNDAQVARLWRHVAQNYQRVGRLYEALNTFRNALKWAPDDIELRTAYVDMLLDDGRLVAAENQLDDLIEAHPTDVDLLDRRAQVYAGQGYVRMAIADWERVLELQPDHPGAARQIARQHEVLGDNSHRWGRVQDAMMFYQQGLEYAPEDGMLLVSVGMCHLDMGDKVLARQFFERAYAAEPTNANIYLLATKTWLEDGDEKAAQAVIERARDAIELAAGFFLDLAAFCYSWQFLHLVHDYIEEARTLAANDANQLVLIAELAGRNGDLELAQEILQDAIKIDPDNAILFLVQGLVLVSQRDLPAARRSWDQAERIARETNNETVLMAVEEMRFHYDPERGPGLGLLRRMLTGPMFDDHEWVDDDDWLDDDEEWF
jgi:tetratricopeptide (TPR) repeat protein